jgi:hypothetical protein
MIQEGSGMMKGQARPAGNGISLRTRASLIGFAATWLKSTHFL